MIISKSKKFIYIHLSKCGGTSIEDALKPFLSSDDIKLGNLTPQPTELERFYFEKYYLRKHSSAQDIKHYLGTEWDDMYKFTTVRNPKDAMISLYFYTKKFFHNNDDHIFSQVYKKSVIEDTGIDGFICEMIKEKHHSVLPYSLKIDETVNIFDIEYIDYDWKHILNNIGIHENVKLNKLNMSDNPKNIKLKDTTIDLIHDNFKIDYDNIPKITGHKWQ